MMSKSEAIRSPALESAVRRPGCAPLVERVPAETLAGGAAAAILVEAVINLRMIAYAAALAPDWRRARVAGRLLVACALTDAPWSMSRNASDDPRARRRFYVGAAGVLWFGWPAMVTAGVFVGELVSLLPGAGLLPGVTLALVALPRARDRPAVAVVVGVATFLRGRGPVTALAATVLVYAALAATCSAPPDWSGCAAPGPSRHLHNLFA